MPLETVHMSASKAKDGNSSSDFKATPEELRSIQERMKDPKFVKLMHEYMESLSNPETRAEEEAYLEQAEREAKEGGDYTFDFIFPRPSFVVELANPTTKEVTGDALHKLTGSKDVKNKKVTGNRSTTAVRSFINICHSEKVEPFRENFASDARQSHWHVPVAVSEKRLEYYYENKTKPKSIPASSSSLSDSSSRSNTENAAAGSQLREAYAEVQAAAGKAAATPLDSAPFCYVYDAVFHEQTLSLANRSNRFMCFLVEIAVEQINAGYKESNGFEFTRLPTAVMCIGYPRNQTIRKKGTSSPFAVDPSAPVLTKPTKNLAEVERASRAALSKASTTTTKSSRRVSTTIPASTATPCTPVGISSLPPFQIKHRGNRVDFSDTWEDHRIASKKIGVPEILLVTMDFSSPPVDGQANHSDEGKEASKKKIIQCSSIDVAVTSDGTGLQLTKTAGQPYYEGLVVLPFSVDEDPLSAKFDKQKRVLSLELKVQAHHHLLQQSTLAMPRSDPKATSSLPENVDHTLPTSSPTVPVAPLHARAPSPVAEQEGHAGALLDAGRREEESPSGVSSASVVPTASSSSSASSVGRTMHVDATVPAVESTKEGKNAEDDPKEGEVRPMNPSAAKEEGRACEHHVTHTATTAPPLSSSSSSIPRPPSPSVFSSDTDRVRLMFAKVEEARRAREEAALASAATSEVDGNSSTEGQHRKDDEEKRSESSLKHSGGAVPTENARDEATLKREPEGEVDAGAMHKRGGKKENEAMAAEALAKGKGETTEQSAPCASGPLRTDTNPKCTSHPSSRQEEPPHSPSAAVERKSHEREVVDGAGNGMPNLEMTTEREKALKEMERQQDAWMKSVQDAIPQEDTREMEAAARRARKEAESAKKRYEAVLEEEKLEKKMRAKRAAAPFCNVHIFSID